jgi:hypothetical protein
MNNDFHCYVLTLLLLLSDLDMARAGGEQKVGSIQGLGSSWSLQTCVLCSSKTKRFQESLTYISVYLTYFYFVKVLYSVWREVRAKFMSRRSLKTDNIILVGERAPLVQTSQGLIQSCQTDTSIECSVNLIALRWGGRGGAGEGGRQNAYGTKTDRIFWQRAVEFEFK